MRAFINDEIQVAKNGWIRTQRFELGHQADRALQQIQVQLSDSHLSVDLVGLHQRSAQRSDPREHLAPEKPSHAGPFVQEIKIDQTLFEDRTVLPPNALNDLFKHAPYQARLALGNAT